jgi:O-methyltransferase involved in polyketide biosynthesis
MAGTVSRSAVNVTLARWYLTRSGLVDDQYAWQMLPRYGRRVAAVVRLPGPRHVFGRDGSIPYLAARTRFFDRFVRDALDGGCRQVVILAAGFDSRAWRLARPGATFFEVDRPATQEDKRTRAPAGGLAGSLRSAGFRPGEPTALTMEGLTVYLSADDVAALLARLADLAPTGSRLAVSFESGFQGRPVMRRVVAAVNGRGGETFRFRLRAEDAPSFLAGSGWTVDRVLTAPDLDGEHLAGTSLAGKLRGVSFTVTAHT